MIAMNFLQVEIRVYLYFGRNSAKMPEELGLGAHENAQRHVS